MGVAASRDQIPQRKLVRAYIDGCFDLMHSGHYNAIRQAKQLCDVLVVGIHSDDEIATVKARPVINQDERYELLRHIKWADEILLDAPYSPLLATLEKVQADFCVHGDDLPVGADGRGAYDNMRDAGKLRIIKRTEGVSTTDCVERLLMLAKETEAPEVTTEIEFQPGHRALLTTTRRIAEFSSRRMPSEDDVIVYFDGTFDLFHVGHALNLKQAKEFGTYLLVGVHDDESVVAAGGSRPIMSLHERVLNVCSCKYVDEVIIGAPTRITGDLLASMNISFVVAGERSFPITVAGRQTVTPSSLDAYTIPRNRGILRSIEDSKPDLNPNTIAQRVLGSREAYIKRNEVRMVREDEYYKNKEKSQSGVIER